MANHLEQLVLPCSFLFLILVAAKFAEQRARLRKGHTDAAALEAEPLLTKQRSKDNMVLLAPTQDLNKFLPKAAPQHLPTPAKDVELLTSSLAASHLAAEPERPAPPPAKKRIAIIGAGTAGIGALIGLQNIPEEVRKEWSIELFERREDVGGVWFPDYSPPVAPNLPDSPLYAQLHTNTPAPTMTYPSGPRFPPGTEMFPSHTAVLAYHKAAVKHHNLSRFINFNHSVVESDWVNGEWRLTFDTPSGRQTRSFDHLICAVGRYRYPKIPIAGFEQLDSWAAAGDRKVEHSLWFREPLSYAGRDVVVVGFGASGWDMASKTQATGQSTVYHSYSQKVGEPNGKPLFPPIPGTITKPRISHFAPDAIHFEDGTKLESDKVTVLLGTGYNLEIPFLKPLKHVAQIDPHATRLTGNGSIIRPLWKDLFAIDERWPRNALAFMALPWFIANGANDEIQGLTIGHAIADEDLLPTREAARKEVAEAEEETRKAGHEPFSLGHKFYGLGQPEAYQDSLAQYLRDHSRVALPGKLALPYVEPWRRWARGWTELGSTPLIMRRGWNRALERGIGQEFVGSAESEEEWEHAMRRLFEWELEQNEIEPRSLTEQ